MTKSNECTTTEAITNYDWFTPVFKDFYCFASTRFGDYLTECGRLFDSRPDLTAKIAADLDRHGLAKKKLREADRLFRLNRTRPLEGFEDLAQARIPGSGPDESRLPGKLEVLETGRPRMPAEVVGVFLLVRPYKGSCTNQEAIEFMQESKSLEAFLAKHGLTMPGRSTMNELINAVSLETRECIFRAHLEGALGEGLDGFDQVLIDSTAAKANSRWPTDAQTIFGLLQRLFRVGHQFKLFNLKDINPGRMEEYLKKMEGLPFQINLNAKKKKKFAKFCREFIELAAKALFHADGEFKRLEPAWKEMLNDERILPSLRDRAAERVELFGESLHLISKSIEQMRQRVFEGKTFPSTERVLSIHDHSAAYIKKGGREAVIGYKPQLARSGNGYVVGLYVGEGNISDSKSLVPMVEQTIANTGVTPEMVSVDDGYSSRAGHDQVIEFGVKTVSISGAKGKKLLGDLWDEEEYCKARAGRSAVESLMYCLKYCFRFGRLVRVGLAAVREEFLEKCIAYNICRTIELRKRKRKQPQKPELKVA